MIKKSLNEENSEEFSILLKESLLGGKILDIPIVLQAYPKSQLRVFVSSTFTDTFIERNLLHERIIPKLQQEYRDANIQIVCSDLRFGIKDQNTIDHLTWISCKKELIQCYEESGGCFFLSLQSEKYGYLPLPKYIPKPIFEERIDNHRNELSQALISLLHQWYTEDLNQVSPSHYELKKLEKLNDSRFWNHCLPTLRDQLLSDLPFDYAWNDDDDSNDTSNARKINEELLINRSVTEWETKLALSLDAQRCAWVHRTFDHSQQQHPLEKIDIEKYQRKCANLCDWIGNPALERKYQQLKEIMRSTLSKQNIIDFDNITKLQYSDYTEQEPSPSFLIYLAQWEESVYNKLQMEIQEVLHKIANWKTLTASLIVTSSTVVSKGYIEEIFHHNLFSYRKSLSFLGRERLIDHAMEVILQSSPSNRRVNLNEKKEIDLSGVSCCIIGSSGSGKTSLISKLSILLRQTPTNCDDPPSEREENLKPIPMIVRYCGTSSLSLHASDLVRTIIVQLLSHYEQVTELNQFLEGFPRLTYLQLLESFRKYLNSFPVYLLIDSLDQLSDRNEARSSLNFLQNINLHERSRLIVSSLPDADDSLLEDHDHSISEGEQRQPQKNESYVATKYFFLCETRLKEENVPSITVANEVDNVEVFFSKLLEHRYRRRLTSDQLMVVSSSIQVEPTILYMNLALEIVSKWRSFDLDVQLQPTMPGIIHQFFTSLETEFGEHLTRAAFGYLTFARQGINDLEMQDLLSLRDEVMKEVFQYSSLSRTRLPIHVWLRLKDSIRNLITDKGENHCFGWYHRQIQEIAELRYANKSFHHKDDKKKGDISNSNIKFLSHYFMGIYFTNRIDSAIKKDRLIQSQELLLDNNRLSLWLEGVASKVNRRRVIEGYHHLLRAEEYATAIEEMCSIEFVLASSLIGDQFKYMEGLHFLKRYLMSIKIKRHGDPNTNSSRQESSQHKMRFEFPVLKKISNTLFKKRAQAAVPTPPMTRQADLPPLIPDYDGEGEEDPTFRNDEIDIDEADKEEEQVASLLNQDISEESINRFNDYYHWTSHALSIIATDPISQIPRSASSESLASHVRNDLVQLLSIYQTELTELTFQQAFSSLTDPRKAVWMRGLSFHPNSTKSEGAIADLIDSTMTEKYEDLQSSRNDVFIGSLTSDGTFTLWNADTHEIIRKFYVGNRTGECFQWHPNPDVPLVAVKLKYENVVQIYNAQTGGLVKKCPFHCSSGFFDCQILWNPTAERLAIGGRKYMSKEEVEKQKSIKQIYLIYIMNVEDGKTLFTFQEDQKRTKGYHSGESLTLGWVRDNPHKLISIIIPDNRVTVWDTNSGAMLVQWSFRFWNLLDETSTVALSRSTDRLAVVRSGGVHIWSMKTHRSIKNASLPFSNAASWTFDDSKIVLTSSSGSIQVVEVASLTVLHMINFDEHTGRTLKGSMQRLSAANHSDRVLFLLRNQIKVWDLSNIKREEEKNKNNSRKPFSIKEELSLQKVVKIGWLTTSCAMILFYDKLELWRISGAGIGERMTMVEPEADYYFGYMDWKAVEGHRTEILLLTSFHDHSKADMLLRYCYHPDSGEIAFTQSICLKKRHFDFCEPRRFFVWIHHTQRNNHNYSHNEHERCIIVEQRGDDIKHATNIRCYDLEANKFTHTLESQDELFFDHRAVALNSSKTLLTVLTFQYVLTTWDVSKEGESKMVFHGRSNAHFRRCRYQARDKEKYGDHVKCIRSLTYCTEPSSSSSSSSSSSANNVDSHCAISIDYDCLKIIDARTGDSISLFQFDPIEDIGLVFSLSFCCDNQYLISGGFEVIHCWNVSNQQLLKTLAGLNGSITSLSISPDQSKLLSGSSDGKIMVWKFDSK